MLRVATRSRFVHPLALLVATGCGPTPRPLDAGGSDVVAPDGPAPADIGEDRVAVDDVVRDASPRVDAPDATAGDAPDAAVPPDAVSVDAVSVDAVSVDAVSVDAVSVDAVSPDAGPCGVSGICPPRPVAPSSTARVTSPRPVLRWALAAATDGARADVCRDRALTARCVTLAASGGRVALTSDLAPGPWYWRLRGRRGAAEGTAASPVWQFVVAPGAAPRGDLGTPRVDIDADGYADVVVAWQNSGAIGVYAGSGAGVSATPWRVIRGAEPGALAWAVGAGDVDGDGFGDIASAGPQGVLVHRGGAAGPHDVPVAATAADVFGFGGAGDVNGDGYADIVLKRRTDAPGGRQFVVEVFHGGPAGLTSASMLTEATPLFNGQTQPFPAGDLDGDGFDDLVVSSTDVTTARVYRGGPMGIGAAAPVTVGPGFHARAAGDVNGDGYGDLVALVSGGAHTFFGGAAGVSATPSSAFAAGAFEQPIAAGDLNGDGYGDVATLASGPSNAALRIYPGSAAGARLLQAAIAPPEARYFAIRASAPGDVNGDGFDDVAVLGGLRTGGGDARVFVHLGRAQGLDPAPATRINDPTLDGFGAALAPAGRNYLVTRLDGPVSDCSATACLDRHAGMMGVRYGASVASLGPGRAPDIHDVIVGAPGAARAYVHLNDLSAGPRRVVLASPAGGDFGAAVAGGGDTDLDRFNDLAVGAPSVDRAWVYAGGPSGPLAAPVAALTGPAGSGFGAALAITADLDRDGAADLVVGAPNAARVFVFRGGRAGLATAPAFTLAGPAGSRFGAAVAAIGDIDGDGIGDIAVGAPGADRAYVYRGAAAGTPVLAATLAGPAGGEFGAAVAGAAPGYVAVGAPGAQRALIYRASLAGLAAPSDTVTGPEPRFGQSVAVASGAVIVGARGAVAHVTPRPPMSDAAAPEVARASSPTTVFPIGVGRI